MIIDGETIINSSYNYYVERVLGDLPPKSTMHVITEIDPNTGALFARNPYNTEFRDRVAFFDVIDATRTASGDRTEFLGRNGSLRAPAAMTRTRLSGKMGTALDPCAAIQVSFELAAGEEREIIFRLGVWRDADDAGNLVNRFRGSTAARGTLDVVWEHWTHTLGEINVETPDQSLNVLTNGWLLVQTLACRLDEISVYLRKVARVCPLCQCDGPVTALMQALIKAVSSTPGAALVCTLAIRAIDQEAADAYKAEHQIAVAAFEEVESVVSRKLLQLDPTEEDETINVLRRRLILCKASSNRWYVCRANHKPQRRRKPNEILHQTAPILLRNRSAHKKDVRVHT